MASENPNPVLRVRLIEEKATALSVLTGTWNAGNAAPPSDLDPWIPSKGGDYDLIVVGFQECTFKEKLHNSGTPRDEEDAEEEAPETHDVDLKQLELELLGSKQSRRNVIVGSEAGATQQKDVGVLEKAAKFLQSPATTENCPAFDVVRQHIGSGYTCLHSALMWQIGVMVFSKNSIVDRIDDLQSACEATGLMGITPNKGGVVVTLRVDRSTTLAFVSSHLAAHMKHAEHRNLNSVEIINNVRMGNKELDVDSQYTHIFWMGDLNYRLDLAIGLGEKWGADGRGKESPEKWEAVQELIKAEDWNTLVKCDQLLDALKHKLAFTGFREGSLKFVPTFKVKRTVGTVHSQQRISSWCDRVLWKSLPGYTEDVTQTLYTGHPSIATSDHKPVSAAFKIALRPALRLTSTHFPAGKAGPTPDASHPGATVRITNLKGHGLLGMDVSGKSDVYVVFFSDRDLVGPKGKNPKATTQRQTLDPVWLDEQVDEMRIAGRSAGDLRTAHIMAVLMDKDVGSGDDRMGQAVLSLKDAALALGNAVPFDLTVTKGGRAQGRLTGEISLIWPQSDAAAAESLRKRKKDRSYTQCCSVQ